MFKEIKYVDKDKKQAKYNKMIDFINKELAFIISYGDDSEIVPVGNFVANKIHNSDMSTDPSNDILDSIIELKRVLTKQEKENNYALDEKIYVSLRNIKKIINEIPEFSNNKYHLNLSSDDLEEIVRIISDSIDFKNGKIISKYGAVSISLDNLQATYVRNGEIAATNYSIVPVVLGRVYEKGPKKYEADDEEKSFGMRR